MLPPFLPINLLCFGIRGVVLEAIDVGECCVFLSRLVVVVFFLFFVAFEKWGSHFRTTPY